MRTRSIPSAARTVGRHQRFWRRVGHPASVATSQMAVANSRAQRDAGTLDAAAMRPGIGLCGSLIRETDALLAHLAAKDA